MCKSPGYMPSLVPETLEICFPVSQHRSEGREIATSLGLGGRILPVCSVPTYLHVGLRIHLGTEEADRGHGGTYVRHSDVIVRRVPTSFGGLIDIPDRERRDTKSSTVL